MKEVAILKDAVYIPRKYVKGKEDILEENFRRLIYKENECIKCPFIEERHCAECHDCPNFLADIKLWRKKRINGKEYIGLPPVGVDRTKRLFDVPDSIPLIDKREREKFSKPIKFSGKLYEGEVVNGQSTVNQKQAVKAFFKKGGNAIISAPARSGKTALSVFISCHLGVKTLIMADQKEFLLQFYDSFAGAPEGKRKPLTDLSNLSDSDKRKRIRIITKEKDLEGVENVDIVLCNYQKFIRSKKAMQRLTKKLGNRSLVIVDEVDAAAAPAFARVISNLKCRYRLGLSATWERKDNRSFILSHMIGPVAIDIKNTGMAPEIFFTETGISFKYEYRSWVGAMKALAHSKKRNELILSTLKKDFEDGHKSIIIPVDFLEHAAELQRMINSKFGEDTARTFHGRSDSERLLADFDNGYFKVMIAIRRMIKRGIDLRAPTAIYMVVPMSAVNRIGAPMFYQMSYRVATAMEGKKQPIVRIFVDNIGQSTGCFNSLFWNEIYPFSKSKKRYILSDAMYKKAIKISRVSSKKKASENLREISLWN